MRKFGRYPRKESYMNWKKEKTVGVVLQKQKVVSDALTSGLCWCRARIYAFANNKKGQGTTEYAILVGVLVVIAILAITVFRPKIQELWDAIASGINGL